MATAADVKLQAHAMIDRMAPKQVSAVVTLLEAMLDPVSRALANAPVEDETASDEESLAAAASREWLRGHEPISNRELLAEFGLSEAEFERMGQTPLPADR